MRTARCACGNLLFFENTGCVVCGRSVGFLPDLMTVSAIESVRGKGWEAVSPGTGDLRYKKCVHYDKWKVCNWMVEAESSEVFCTSCRLNAVIPDLSQDVNWGYWRRIEQAKRRLVYTLLRLGLVVPNKKDDPEEGLAFRFLAVYEPATGHYTTEEGGERVLTGHKSGVITLNVEEADDVVREQVRQTMGEPYRTLLGHFRHESGHYYWERLVRGGRWLEGFRDRFGDERVDYDECLKQYYKAGPEGDWSSEFISAYAASHPWEDWAETWAHYLHMVDTLETAHDIGFIGPGSAQSALDWWKEVEVDDVRCGHYGEVDFDRMVLDFMGLTVAINSISRSMGLRDFYPFVLNRAVIEKLRFVHDVVEDAHQRNGG